MPSSVRLTGNFYTRLTLVVHTVHLASRRLGEEGYEFEVNLSYIVSCKLSLVAYRELGSIKK